MANKQIVVDSHVHIYNCFDFASFLREAGKNLAWLHNSIFPSSSDCVKVLILAEGESFTYFNLLQKNTNTEEMNNILSFPTKEPASLLLKQNNQNVCFVFSGRQVITKEGLEVIAVGTLDEIENSQPIKETVQSLLKKRCLTILPWGVGKWLFRKKKYIRELIESVQSPYLFLGDNSGRPTLWPRPNLFSYGEQKGLLLLNGSDPFPLIRDRNRGGSAGIILDGEWDDDWPLRSFCEILLSQNNIPVVVGRRDDTVMFFKRQFELYLKKHFSG